MAVNNLLLCRTLTVSGNNLSADTDQFIFVKAGATSPQVVAAAADNPVIGVSDSTAKNGEGLNVGMSGITKLRLGAATTHGNLLKPDANGNAINWLGKGPYGAKALQDGAANEVIEALITIGAASSG